MSPKPSKRKTFFPTLPPSHRCGAIHPSFHTTSTHVPALGEVLPPLYELLMSSWLSLTEDIDSHPSQTQSHARTHTMTGWGGGPPGPRRRVKDWEVWEHKAAKQHLPSLAPNPLPPPPPPTPAPAPSCPLGRPGHAKETKRRDPAPCLFRRAPEFAQDTAAAMGDPASPPGRRFSVRPARLMPCALSLLTGWLSAGGTH